MTPELVIVDPPEIFEVAARRFVAAVGEALGQRGACSVCLSGGRTPETLYRVLARSDYSSRIPWDRVDFFWGDERCVPPTHEQSNYRVAHEALLSHIDIQPAQVHRIPGELPTPAQIAARYEDELAAYFEVTPSSGRPPRFDLLLLGLGGDGHTASLFPYGKPLRETERWVVPVERRNELPRVTLTLPVLNAARQIHFLASGDEKSHAIYHVIGHKGDAAAWPARLVQPEDARVLWFIDNAAAGLLKPGQRPRPDEGPGSL